VIYARRPKQGTSITNPPGPLKIKRPRPMHPSRLRFRWLSFISEPRAARGWLLPIWSLIRLHSRILLHSQVRRSALSERHTTARGLLCYA